jgi:hypothetical protein
MVRHAFVNPKSDGGDATIARPSDWNAAHVIGGYDIQRYTPGDFSLGTTVGTLLSGITTSVTAVAGDLLLVGLNARNTDADADSARVDAATIVSAAAVNYLSSLSGTANSLGLPGWFMHASGAGVSVGSPAPYVVQSGDISGGTVTFQLAAWGSGAGKVRGASSATPLIFWVKNLQQ